MRFIKIKITEKKNHDTIVLDELAHARFGHFSAALGD